MLEFELAGYEPIGRGKLEGFVQVRIKPVGIVLRGIRHIKKEYVEFLQQPCKWAWSENQDTKEAIKLFDFDNQSDYQRFQEAILDAIHEHLNDGADRRECFDGKEGKEQQAAQDY
jgi:hypothetical protein